MLDAILAWVQFITIFAFNGCLFAEVFFHAKAVPVATLALIRIRLTAPNAAGLIEVAERSHRLVRACMICEVVLLLFIPLCAALMARGYGYAGS
jgi:uncharacterized membrane protein